MLPVDLVQVVLVTLFVVPGFVYQGTRSRFRGPVPEDQELGVRILRALGMSAFLALVYLILLDDTVVGRIRHPERILNSPRSSALLCLVLIFAVPVVLAGVSQVKWARDRMWTSGFRQAVTDHGGVWQVLRYRWSATFNYYSPIPTAWDHIGPKIQDNFVRILTKDNTWIGGYAGPEKFVSAYPEAREIYLDLAYEIAENGEFGDPVASTVGIWVNCTDIQALQIIEPERREPPAGESRAPAAPHG